MSRFRLVASSAFAVTLALVACRKDSSSSSNGSGSQSLGPSLASAMASAMTKDMGPTTTSVTGSVHSSGGDLGTWDMTIADCQSGERNGFFGADFYVASSDDLRLRYVHDEASGDVVKIAIPSSKDGKFMVFDRDAKCTVREGSVAKTNVKTWTPKGDVRHVDGHVKFDCTNTEGKGHVTGDITFSHCH